MHVIKAVENGNYALAIGRELQLVLVGIDGKDFVDGMLPSVSRVLCRNLATEIGNRKLTLALVWQLMRAQVLNHIANLQYGGKAVDELDVLK